MVPDLLVGRLALAAVEDPITELLGSAITNVGDATAVGQRRAKGFTLNLIVHGYNTVGGDPVAVGNRMRRQLRGMLQNHALRLAGIYFQFAADPERNGWIVIGEGQLSDADGGVTFASYKLALTEAFLTGSRVTAREGYRVDLTDRRLATSPIDYFGEQIGVGAGFSTLTPLALNGLPVGAVDVNVRDQPVSTGMVVGMDGPTLIMPTRSAGDVVSWERAEQDFNKGDVVILDRRGNALPSGPAIVSRNEVRNPRAALGLNDVAVSSPTLTPALSRVTTDGYQGSTCFQMVSPAALASAQSFLTFNYPAPPVVPVTAVVFVRCAVKITGGDAGTQVQLGVNVMTGNAISGQQPVHGVGGAIAGNIVQGQWMVLEGWTTLTAGNNQAQPWVMVTGSATPVTVRVADGQQVLDPQGVPPYVAGDLPGCQWDTGAHASGSSLTATAINLIQNGSFENDVAGWTGTASGASTIALARDSSWSDQGAASMRVSGSQAATGDYVQVFPAAASSVYGGQEIVVRLKAKVLTARSAWTVQLNWYDSNAAVSTGETIVIPAAPGVYEIVLVVAAPATAKTMRPTIFTTGATGAYNVRVDGVVMKVNPSGGPAPTRSVWRGFNDVGWVGAASVDAANYQALNAKVMRIPMTNIEMAQPQDGAPIVWANHFQWPYFQTMIAAGVKILPCFLSNAGPHWTAGPTLLSADVSTYTAAQGAKFAAIIAAFCTQLGVGNVAAVEVGNEINAAWPSGTPASYVTNWLTPTYNAVKAAGASIPVIAASTVGLFANSGANLSSFNWLTGCYSGGMKAVCNGIAAHPYPNVFGGFANTWGLLMGQYGILGPFQLLDVVRQCSAAAADAGKPIYVTEHGLPTAPTGQGLYVSEPQQATAVRLMNGLLRRMPDVRSILVHLLSELSPPAEDDFGLLAPGGGAQKPAYAAIRSEWTDTPAVYGDGDSQNGGWTGAARNSVSIIQPGAQDPQTLLGWEECYGPDHPLTAADVPVIQNGLCRVRYDPTSTPGFRVDTWDPLLSAWREQGKAYFQRWGDVNGADSVLVAVTILEWTADRAVIQAVMRDPADGYSRERIIITVQRGWTGPRVEVYAAPRGAGTQAQVFVTFVLAGTDTNDSALKIDSGASAYNATAGSSTGLFPTAVLGTTFTGENQIAVLRDGGGWQATLAVLQAGVVPYTTTDTSAYGTSRNAVQLQGPAAGYLSTHLGFAAQAADQIIEAEAIRYAASGTTSQVADASASGGQAVKDTQTALTAITLYNATTSLLQAKYRILARVKVDAGATGSFLAGQLGVVNTSVGTSTSTTWVWIDLGDLLATVPNWPFALYAWRSAGTGGVYVDRVELVLLENRGGAINGARDLGQSVLYQSMVETRRLARG